MYFISKLMRSKLGKKHNLLFFCIRTCVLRDGPLFSEGDGVRWEFGQFSKKTFMQSKTEKNAEKIHTEWEPWEKKLFLSLILFLL